MTLRPERYYNTIIFTIPSERNFQFYLMYSYLSTEYMKHTYLNEGCCCIDDSEGKYEVGTACAPLESADPVGCTISVFKSIKLLLTDSEKMNVHLLVL